ncbi:MAG: hypothetical protein VKS61_18645 [Candidatus Sericytochromatia bacterium]|nr:hypothetical protein [Candidatus Sericytochromatia bacterium]
MTPSPIAANRPTPAAPKASLPAPGTGASATVPSSARFDSELVLSFPKPAEPQPTMVIEGAGPERSVSFLRKLLSF